MAGHQYQVSNNFLLNSWDSCYNDITGCSKHACSYGAAFSSVVGIGLKTYSRLFFRCSFYRISTAVL